MTKFLSDAIPDVATLLSNKAPHCQIFKITKLPNGKPMPNVPAKKLPTLQSE
jgi:hypothetical protein